MPGTQKSFSDRFYRALLHILPFDFRREFESEMKDVFHEQHQETQREGKTALLKLWWMTITDLFKMAPSEHLSVLSMDARYAFRMMRKNLGSTLAAILILGLGVGANTAIFSVVNSVLFKPLPYTDGNRLVTIRQPELRLGTGDALFSVQEIEDFRKQIRSLNQIVEYHNMTFTLFGRGAAHRVRTGIVSANFFNVFGVKPLLGRTFIAADDTPNADPVLVLSYEFWQQVESGDRNIIGKKYEMNDRVHTVIGVLPRIPQYPDENDVYMPTTSCPMRSNRDMMAPRTARMMQLFGRLQENVSLEQFQPELKQVTSRIQEAYPQDYPDTAGMTTTASLLRNDLTDRARPLLLLLWGAAGFVLLISCANVANLIMSRMVAREQELLVRSAVGAGKGRLLRQLLTENVFLAILASAAGLLFAYGSIELMKDFASQFTPRAREISIDRGVLAFTLLCAGLTTIVFGSVAAIYFRQDLSSGLKEGGRTGTERGKNLIRKFLIAAQIAFSFVLLVGAGLMVRSFLQILKVHPGFAPEQVFTIRVNLDGSKFDSAEQRVLLSQQVQERLNMLPGVAAVATSSSFPLDAENQVGGRPLRFRVEGDPRPESECPPITTARSASVDYFSVLGIPLIYGRTFQDSDKADSAPVVILNQALSSKRFGKDNPVGKRITFDNGTTWMTVIGVVANVKEFGLNVETPYQIYRPFAQRSFFGSILVRTAMRSNGISEQFRHVLSELEPHMAIVKIFTMEQARADSVASPRTLTRLFFVFACLALVISVAGISSVLSLWVKQTTTETGIRMALGATPSNILGSFLRQGMALTFAGLLIGLAGALAVTRLLTSLLFQVTATDFATYVTMSLCLLLPAILACYFPARRAANIDAQVALRSNS